MSYVYCGYCGQRGHNKLSCPERKKVARENPDSYVANQLKREAETRAAAVASRTCTYCSEPNHNRRGCDQLKQDKQKVKERNSAYQEEFAEAAAKIGFGPGTIVRLAHGDREDYWRKQVVALVTEMNWSGVDFFYKDTDLSYSTTNRKIAQARVIKSLGWDEEPGSWRGPPAQNSKIEIAAEGLVLLMPDLFSEPDKYAKERMQKMEILSQSTFSSKPSSEEIMTYSIMDTFRFNTRYNAQRWEKERVPMKNKVWQNIYPDTHFKAAEEWLNRD